MKRTTKIFSGLIFGFLVLLCGMKGFAEYSKWERLRTFKKTIQLLADERTPEGQYHLALLHQVDEEYVVARRWLRQSAEQGYLDALFLLPEYYSESSLCGLTCGVDPLEEYAWIGVLANHVAGCYVGTANQEEQVQMNHDLLKRQERMDLSSEQREAAENLEARYIQEFGCQHFNCEDVSEGKSNETIFHIADGLNDDGSLLENYQRGLHFAKEYFGDYGPYHVYLLGNDNEQSVRDIYLDRAIARVNPELKKSKQTQIDEYLQSKNVVSEIESVLNGKSEGGLTWTQENPILFEDVTTNAKQRERDPVENTWGALHEYHHVFQMSHCDTRQPRNTDRHINSWMAEGMATYSSAKFMEKLGLVDFKDYMRQLMETGANIGRPSIMDFLAENHDWKLADETYWEDGRSSQVYYMIGAWATAYLIHVKGVDETAVLRDWYLDIPRIGKAAAFEKYMGLSLSEFYREFESFVAKPNQDWMLILDAR